MRVALQTLAGDGGEAGQAGVAYLAEVLAGLDGADVDLDGRDGDGLEGIDNLFSNTPIFRAEITFTLLFHIFFSILFAISK